jgi:hypothetical protein
MRLRALVLSLATLFTVAASSSRADEAAEGKALLAGGIVSDVGSLASAVACGVLFAGGIGSTLDNPVPSGGNSSGAVIASCTLNVALGVAGVALTVAGAKKLQHGRALHYSLNSVAVRF